MKRLETTVTGMNCTGCEQRIANVLGRLHGVAHVAADHEAGTVVVDYDATTVDESTIVHRLADAGYEAVAAGADR